MSHNFIAPEDMLRHLSHMDMTPCNCTEALPVMEMERAQGVGEEVEEWIVNLQQTLDGFNHEVVEVQQLLSQRDVLFHQLNHLRAEREEIEDQIALSQIQVKKVKVSNTRGLKDMNARLRRRIKEVQDYIDKMDNENTRIESSVNSTVSYTSYPLRVSTEYPCGGSWRSRVGSPSHYSPSPSLYSPKPNYTRDYIDGMRERVMAKQEEAWERVRRQEEEIEQRNARSLIGFNRTANRSNYLSPGYRARY